jgi:hypothetical protein
MPSSRLSGHWMVRAESVASAEKDMSAA